MTFLGRGAAVPAAGSDAAQILWGDFLGLMAGVAWGATTVVVRSSALARASATQTLLYQLLGAAILLCAVAWLTGQTTVHWTPTVVASLVFHALAVSFASFLVWFWLLGRYYASRLGVFSFLTPLFGVVFGAWWLAEPLEPGFIVGAVPVLLGIVLVSGGGWVGQRLRGWRRDLAPQGKAHPDAGT
jgi:drug/metabolite transporter (DMT)-like permease